MSIAEKTLFQEESEKYQDSEERTKKARVKASLIGAGVVLIGLICYTLLLWFLDFRVSPLIAWAIPLLYIAAAVALLYFIIKAVVSAIRSTRTLTCPKCGAENEVYPDIRKFMCTECHTLLLLGEDPEQMPQLSICTYCGLLTAVTSDHGKFICPNCSLLRESSGSAAPVKDQVCPDCNQVILEGVIFCMSCGSILQTDFSQPAQGDPELAYDQDWMIGKDASGHFYFTKAHLKGIGKDLEKAKDLVRLQPIFNRLADALKSLEEAWLDSSMRTKVEPLLCEVDLTYATLLARELTLIQSLPEKSVWPADGLDTLLIEPHIAARKRLESRLGSAPESCGSIGKWAEKLVAVQKKEKNSAIKEYQKLAQETARFRDWFAQQGVQVATS